ncbi:ubiquitin carboxyl-terminal hydrolase MINDY-2 isoform X1 [Gadus chalcogrammus]|uniref:ubiquitin carboxyl-terminal hydrolase MINDY-2 isoform X1 n=1 Tax=Gadus chalcogrammus TaxID=1042646 RepID=UPI0024C4BD5C|nr:ubiquitin carboxyl-terminal hydrolase MINDY-2 isoform X1 [Gadus chalcogrammus]
MEKNANVHEARDTTSPSPRTAGDVKDAAAGSGLKGTSDQCTKSEPPLSSSLVLGSCSDGSSPAVHGIPAVANPQPTNTTQSLPLHGDDVVGNGPWTDPDPDPGPRDATSNGMGKNSVVASGNSEGGTSKLVDSRKGDLLSTPTDVSSTGLVQEDTLGGDGGEQRKPVRPKHLCPDTTISSTSVRSENPADQTTSDGLPSTSDPDPSVVGESRSIDSLESFSNLNSCPSSELNSECLEERGLALSLQSEDGADETKVSCAKDRGAAGQSIYHIKWIKWKEENTPIITQNENGPCPLLAIMNVLLLAWKVKMPPMMEIITAEQLMEYLGDYILDSKPKEISEAQRLNYEQNMSDAMAVLHKLQTGLDVNVRFTGVRVFEYTPECIVFDLLDIPLYHGWLVDPQMQDMVKAVGSCSYNQLVEKIISCKQSENSELAGEGMVAEQFLSSTATQLTYHGLCELTAAVQEWELCVFFRNNHFSTMIKHKGQLYHLVTDQGFLTEEKVVWESLHNVDGDGNFCDSEFRLRPPSDPETVYRGQQDQIDQDYLMALSLQQQSAEVEWAELPEGVSDLELAKKLQEEEDRRASQYYQEQEQEQQGQEEPAGAEPGHGESGAAAADVAPRTGPGGGVEAAVGPPSSPGKQPAAGERKPKKESKDKDKCVLL